MNELKSISVKIPGRHKYDILVGSGILSCLPVRIQELELSKSVLIVSNPTVFGLYGASVSSILTDGGCRVVGTAIFPDGETHKTLASFQDICGAINDAEVACAEKVLIVNLGGGVVTDVGAFVAACYDRGRDFVNVSTTLLGDVDSGIGGKCGVNFRGKNLIGQFHQSRLTVADTDVLRTLPAREVASGLAEVIKYGVSLDAKFFDDLTTNIKQIVKLEPDAISGVVAACCRMKADIVAQDEFDTKGIRAKLNFGHTIGHALEAATDYRIYSHGEAIAIGMICACEIAERLGIFGAEEAKKVESLCVSAGLPVRIKGDVDADAIMRFMKHDKKFVNGKNRFVLPTAIGTAVLKEGIDEAVIRDVIAGRMSRA